MPHLTGHAADIIATYGYPAVLLLGALEGEAALILGGIAAQQGLLWLPWVMGLAMAGGVLGDAVWFALGRYRGRALLRRYPRFDAAVGRALRFIERRPRTVSFWAHFLYGLRNLVPFSVGLSGARYRTVLPFYALGVVVWGTAVGTLGYFAGGALELAFLGLRRYRIAAVVIAVGLGWLVHSLFSWWRSYLERRAREAE